MANIVLFAILLGIWYLLAPVGLGGQVSYVMVNGNSMEPIFYLGDLVIIRQAEDYQVGDIVTYQDAESGTHVIHRIIKTIDNRFIMKGDNNSWVDAYNPTKDEIIGKAWVYVPKAGKIIQWMRTPLHAALLIALLGGFMMLDVTAQTKKSKKKRKANFQQVGWFEITLFALGILAVGFLILGIVAFLRPAQRAADNIPYTQSGAFSYTGASAAGIYDTDSVQSGDPIFTKLTCNLNLGFVYALEGNSMENLTGSQQFYALVKDEQSGWQRTLPLTADTPFTGNTFSNSTTLDLCQVESLVADMEQETGFRLSNAYSLEIVSRVTVKGQISGQELSTVFAPNLTFKFDSLHFFVENSATQADSMQTIQSGFVMNSSQVPNTLSILGLKPSVVGARITAVVGLLLSLLGLLFLYLYFHRTTKNSPVDLIQLKYGGMIIDVSEHGLGDLSSAIEVATIDDLAKLAERENVMIMHVQFERKDVVYYYLVRVNGTTYRYVSGKGRDAM
jgi:signal peptidase I